MVTNLCLYTRRAMRSEPSTPAAGVSVGLIFFFLGQRREGGKEGRREGGKEGARAGGRDDSAPAFLFLSFF